jgi:hypothetical protein
LKWSGEFFWNIGAFFEVVVGKRRMRGVVFGGARYCDGVVKKKRGKVGGGNSDVVLKIAMHSKVSVRDERLKGRGDNRMRVDEAR